MSHRAADDMGMTSAPTRLFLRRLGAEIALHGACGPAFICGSLPDELLEGVAAAASELIVHGGEKRVRELRRRLRASHPAAVLSCAHDGEGLPVYDQVASMGLITELPERASADAMERVLSLLGDGADVFVLIPRRARSEEGRLQRMLSAACDGQVAALTGAPEHLWAWRGKRVTTVTVESTAAAASLPITAVVVARGDGGMEFTLTDLLLRQHYAPTDVFVLDLGGEIALDPDLHGVPARSSARVAVFPKHGAALGEALQDALGGIQTPFAYWCDAGDRIAPYALAQLGMALEATAEARVAVASAALLAEGEVGEVLAPLSARARILEQRCFPSAAALWRTSALRAGEWPDAEAAHFSLELAWQRLDEGVVVAPGVLAGVNANDLSAADWRAFLQSQQTNSAHTDPCLAARMALLSAHPEDAVRLACDASVPSRLIRAQALAQMSRTAEAMTLVEQLMHEGHVEAAILFLMLPTTKSLAGLRLARGLLRDAGLKEADVLGAL